LRFKARGSHLSAFSTTKTGRQDTLVVKSIRESLGKPCN
jgi:hypothetical protein